MFSSDYETLRSALERRRFTVHAAANAGEAVEIGLSLIGNGSAGFGGSVTVKELGFYEALAERGNAGFSCALRKGRKGRNTPQGADGRLVYRLNERPNQRRKARQHRRHG